MSIVIISNHFTETNAVGKMTVMNVPCVCVMCYVCQLFLLFTVDFVTAPFEMYKMNIYKGYENPDTFFRSGLRYYLVRHQFSSTSVLSLQIKVLDFIHGI